MAICDLEWYKSQWNKTGKEIYEKAVEGSPGSDLFDRLRVLAEIRLTDRIQKATWALVFVGIEKLLQNTSAHLLHRRPDGSLAGFQIHMPQLLTAPQNSIYGALDFFFNFLPNRLAKVFFKVSISCSSSITRGGLNWQIFSLTSTSSLVSSTKRR